MDILSVGLMVCDIIIKPIDEAVFSADSARLDTLKILAGGDGLNVAINMAKLGNSVGLVGRTGNDKLGELLVSEAERYGINTSSVIKSDDYATSTSIVMVEKSGERHFAYYGMANDSLSIRDVNEALIDASKIVHVGGAMALSSLDGRGLAELFKKAKALGTRTSMDVTWDSSGRWLEKIEEALYYTDIFMPSYNESRMISGCETPIEMRSFFKKYGIRIFVVKLGADGCYVTNFKDEYFIETFKNVTVVDTTGAGDAFVSGFLTGVGKGWDIYRCGTFGNAVAALCVTGLGATAGTKTLNEVMEFIKGSNNGLII